MLAELIAALATGLKIWNSKEKTKYIDDLHEAEKDYYAELQKPIDQRSDDDLARIKQRVRSINKAFCAAVAATGTEGK